MGCGDWIMATGEARAIKAADPGAKILIGDGRIPHWEPWFAGNDDLADPRALAAGDPVRWVISCAGARPYLDYNRTTTTYQAFRPDYRPKPGRIVLHERWYAEAERLKSLAKVRGAYVVIEPVTKGGFGGNKIWPKERWEALVRSASDLQFAQIGSPQSPSISGVRRVQTPNIQTAFAVLSKAAAVVTTDGALHHAAAAFGVPAVVLWGARVRPLILGYAAQRNIYTGNGTDCGAIVPCQHCADGMRAITPDMVLKELRCALSSR